MTIIDNQEQAIMDDRRILFKNMEGKDSADKAHELGSRGPKPRYSCVVEGPIAINEKGDLDKIGSHYAALHMARCGEAYKILGAKIKVRYDKKYGDDGTTVVNVIADHY